MDNESHIPSKVVSNIYVPNENQQTDQLIQNQMTFSNYRKHLSHNSNASSQTTKVEDTTLLKEYHNVSPDINMLHAVATGDGINSANAMPIRNVDNKNKTQGEMYYTDDLLFEEFQVKGIVDRNLDSKINEYKSNLTVNSLNVKEDCTENMRTHSLSLRIEYNMIKSSLECSTTQLNNLKSLVGMKDKKLEILENALSLMFRNGEAEANPKCEISQNNLNNFKRKQKHNSMNIQSLNFLKENSSIALTSFVNNNNANTNASEVNLNLNTDTTHHNDVSNNNISFRNYKRKKSKKEQSTPSEDNVIDINNNQIENNEEHEEIDKKHEILKQELLELIVSQNKEIEELTESINKNYSVEIKNEKLKYEEKLRELNSENLFLFNNLQIEIEFLSNKMKNRESGYIEYELHRKELEDQIEALKCKKNRTIEKYAYYRSLLSNLFQIGKTEEENKELYKCMAHNRSRSFNQQRIQKDESTVLSHLDCDIAVNTNQESQSSRKNISLGTEMNINTLQLNYGSENALMIPYPVIAKAGKNKITFEKKACEKNASNKSMFFGNISKISSASVLKNEINDRLGKHGMNNHPNTNANTNTNINLEDYMSNSAIVEIQNIRTFNTKFIKP